MTTDTAERRGRGRDRGTAGGTAGPRPGLRLRHHPLRRDPSRACGHVRVDRHARPGAAPARRPAGGVPQRHRRGRRARRGRGPGGRGLRRVRRDPAVRLRPGHGRHRGPLAGTRAAGAPVRDARHQAGRGAARGRHRLPARAAASTSAARAWPSAPGWPGTRRWPCPRSSAAGPTTRPRTTRWTWRYGRPPSPATPPGTRRGGPAAPGGTPSAWRWPCRCSAPPWTCTPAAPNCASRTTPTTPRWPSRSPACTRTRGHGSTPAWSPSTAPRWPSRPATWCCSATC